MIKQGKTTASILLGDGTLHDLGEIKPPEVTGGFAAIEVPQSIQDANICLQMMQVPIDFTAQIPLSKPSTIHQKQSNALGWAILRMQVDNMLYEWQIFIKGIDTEAITFVLLSKETVTDLSKQLIERATDAVTVLERGLRHLQMEAPDATVSWLDDKGFMRWYTLSEYVDHVIREAKEKCRK